MDVASLADASQDCAHQECGDTTGDGTAAAHTATIRLLIIDDEIPQNNPMVGLLAFQGVEATCALRGASGVELAWSGGFDAILLDLKLPDMLGMTVLSALRRLGIGVPVVVVTGWFLQTDHDERAIQLGAAAFLRKPLFDMDELAALLRQIIAHYVPAAEAPASPRSVRPPSAVLRSPQADSASDLAALHQRARQGDGDACDAIAARLLPGLRRRLRGKRPYATPDAIESSVVDALVEYAARPRQYDDTRGRSLIAHLAYAAKRNLLNYWTAAWRRSKHETIDVAVEFWDGLRAPESANDPWADERAWLRSVLPTVTADFAEDERTVFALQMADEHETSVYARALHITHLTVEEQVRYIRRVTARVSKRVRRGLARLRGTPSDRGNG